MPIAELPAAVYELCHAGKVSGLVGLMPFRLNAKLRIRCTHGGQVRSKNVHPQVIAPPQVNVFDGSRKAMIAAAACWPVANCRRPSEAIRKEGLSRKNLLHAAGPSCVTSCATVETTLRTLLSTAVFCDCVKEG